MKFNEYETVKLKKIFKDYEVPIGKKGAVLMIFDGSPTEYLVEFIDSKGKTIGLITIPEEYLEKID